MTNVNLLKKEFKNPDLLAQALTHKSWVNEHSKNFGTNERLEFLGDAVLELIVSKHLYEQFPDKEEGYLTALRANLVNTTNLAAVAVKLELGEHLNLSRGEEETGGRKNPSLLADTVEAIIGALFIDSGFVKVERFVKLNLLTDIDIKLTQPLKDPKSRLQEIVQAKGVIAPKYTVVAEAGPDHAKEFVVEVVIDGKPLATGAGRSKGEAEQKAAEEALKSF